MTGALLSLLLACSVERGAVKQMTDLAAANVDVSKPTLFTIQQLRRITPPPKWGNDLPRLPWEFEVVTVDAEVVGFKLEDDGDYHVVIQQAGKPGLRMIAELIDPDCAAPAYVDQVRAAREVFVLMFGKPTKKFQKLPMPRMVRITAVLFFDHAHGQLGRAPNDLELHPVIQIQ